MISLQRFTRDGIEYELVTNELIARDKGERIMVHKETGKRKIFHEWDYNDEKPPAGWELDSETLPRDSAYEREMASQGKTYIINDTTGDRRVFYLADGTPPEVAQILISKLMKTIYLIIESH